MTLFHTFLHWRNPYAFLLFIATSLLGTGCCATGKRPDTPGEQGRNIVYGYIPLDPLPAGVKPANATPKEILDALPDETMRLAIGLVEGQGKVTYGPATLGYEGSTYVVTVDYIKYNTKSLGLMKNPAGGYAPAGSTAEATVPVYVGVGLRMTATLTVRKGDVNLGNLVAIGVAAEAKKVTGSIVIQTLGITGPGISSAIPIPTDINTTTIQNALIALGVIKGKMYTTEATIKPRVVGIFKNFEGGSESVNSVISILLTRPLELDTTPGIRSPL